MNLTYEHKYFLVEQLCTLQSDINSINEALAAINVDTEHTSLSCYHVLFALLDVDPSKTDIAKRIIDSFIDSYISYKELIDVVENLKLQTPEESQCND